MKLNWGTGITIAIVMFMGFILMMVFKATQTQTDLYADDYYAQEINYEQRITAQKNANALSGSLEFSQDDSQILIEYPTDFMGNNLDGTILLYRVEDATKDKQFSVSAVNNKQLVSKSNLALGNYKVKVTLNVNGKTYFIEKDFEVT